MQIVGKRCLFLTWQRFTLYNLWNCTIIHWLCSLGRWRGIKAYRMDHMALPLRGDWSMRILWVYVTFDALNLYHFAVFSLYFWKNIHIQNSIVRLQANCDRAFPRKCCKVKVTKIRYQTIKSISYKQPFYHFAKIKSNFHHITTNIFLIIQCWLFVQFLVRGLHKG